MSNPPSSRHALRLPASTRRGFLRLAGATAAFSALAQLPVLPAAAACSATPPPGGRFFDDTETEILTQLMQRIVETGLPDAPRVRDTRAVATVDSVCRGLDPAVSGLLPLALRLVEWGPPCFDLRFARFTRLPPDEQDASLRSWMTSKLAFRRSAFLGLRNLCFLGWYSQPESWSLIGYQGPLLRRADAGRAPA
ncbi:MAG TPA: hypothetical protein VII72_10010 [Myxococcota bacterium]|jgi:hypothetical protein